MSGNCDGPQIWSFLAACNERHQWLLFRALPLSLLHGAPVISTDVSVGSLPGVSISMNVLSAAGLLGRRRDRDEEPTGRSRCLAARPFSGRRGIPAVGPDEVRARGAEGVRSAGERRSAAEEHCLAGWTEAQGSLALSRGRSCGSGAHGECSNKFCVVVFK